MISNEDKVRAAIAEQAAEWLVANDERPLDARDSAALAAWLKASPVHIEEFLSVSAIVRDLKAARTDPEYSLEAILTRSRAKEDIQVRPLWARVTGAVPGRSAARWLGAAVTMAACTVLGVGLVLFRNARINEHAPAAGDMTALHFETRHGEQLSRRLPDNSLLHLNTDTAVTIRYGKTERLITLASGEADFQVTHEPTRPFRVSAGSAEVVDIGTQFNVRLEHDSTVVTVVEGRISVGPSSELLGGMNSNPALHAQFVELTTDQQIIVTKGAWPAAPIAVDAHRTTSWMRRQITFDHEPLSRVATEFNRYTSKPIEIATPALRDLEISGVFATDDMEAFIAFLRSLEGVHVEMTATRIRVTRD